MINRLLRRGAKTALLLMSLCFAFSTAAFAETAAAGTAGGSSTVTMTFPDVPVGHWAEKSITKLALLGVVHGDSLGKYMLNNNITKQEAVVMAIGLMGLGDQVDSDTDFYIALNTKDYAKGYVKLALDQGIISLSEEMTDQNLLESWGDINVTREWAARLIVRAIGKNTEAQSLSASATTFSDDSQISSAMRGYINEAVKLGIIKGKQDAKDKTKYSFDPQGDITRAEMAVMMSAAEPYLAKRSDKVVSGTVQSISSQSVQLELADGTEGTYTMAANAELFDGTTNKRIYTSDIKPYYQATVIQIDGLAYYVEVTNSQVQYDEISGTLVDLSLADSQLIINVNGQQSTYTWAASPTVLDKDGNGLNISSLTKGSELTVRVTRDNPQVVSITVQAAPVIAMIQGAVETIDAANNKVQVKDSTTGIDGFYQIPAGVAITSGDDTLSGVADLHIGDVVSIQTKDDAVTSFELIQSSVKVVQGIVDSVNLSNESIYLNVGSDQPLQGYYTDPNVKVSIGGLTDAELADIHSSDAVSIEVNGDNRVTKITVQNRKIDSALGVVVNAPYDGEYNSIILIVDDKQQIFYLSDRTVLENNGFPVALKDAATTFPKDRKVDITYSGTQLISMRVTNMYEGTVAQINSTTRTIKLTTANYGTLTFPYNYVPYVSIFGRTNAGLGDVAVGNKVRLMLDTNQQYVVAINVQSSKFFTLTSDPYSSTSYVVKDVFGTQYSLSVDIGATITNYNGQTMGYSDLKANQYIYATFFGSNVESVYVPKFYLGKVTAVDSASGKFKVNNFSTGITSTLSFSASSQIVYALSVSSSLNAIAADDHVQIVEGPDNAYLIKRIQGAQKTFFQYNSQLKQIVFTRSTLTEDSTFDLADDVYVHQGNQMIALSSLKQNDKLMIYMMNDVVVEIEKISQ